ncbi:GAF domain-containing protein [Amycolatopsis japonica]|uniref:GAF domain-containing protein n=1 Tax=Amycolatopsis keratiniphila subsp. keratiniphila TaxID=227715 RepID=A0A1W2LJS6_9PSEU|nr:GAF domain-containing protein [Amycolatopsis keratiniphila]OLZ49642.1 GAF domain-containing protein [Amycolatopsis keratiniphila subsp. nogabecina]ONF63118.1 GAF domain-containing protein [Amycolatopsis keratiniphila subsp. keratiniphila]SDU22345.1 GAF domain-containing protein [Amycolatopsis keratiniphila]
MTVSLSTVEDKTRATIGVRLFTVLAWVPERRALRRVHSSHPVEYPVGGEKTVEVAAGWLDRCITGQEPYFGPDSAAVREIFADHELIDSLGCGAVINVPVVDDGRTLGVLNLLDAEGHYDDDSVAVARSLAPLAVPALRELLEETR